MKYRRMVVPGGTFFFTVVTFQRRTIFSSPDAVSLLRDAFRRTMAQRPFTVVASVVLPDHLHIIWTLPAEITDYSTRWTLIKRYFTQNWTTPDSIYTNPSRLLKGEKEVWQRRFWEHHIRDESDLARHIEYIHYNPVKHGYVRSPAEWEYSSFRRFVQNGIYSPDWGAGGNTRAGENHME